MMVVRARRTDSNINKIAPELYKAFQDFKSMKKATTNHSP